MRLKPITGDDGSIQYIQESSYNNVVETNSSEFADVLAEATGERLTLETIFQKASNTYEVDVDLLKAMAKAESNFQSDATSRSGAMGIMQLMPATAEYLGVSNAYDPEQNIMGGAKYIAQLLDKYDGNVSYALAAYNAGSGNVDKYGGIPPFEETQNYVEKILGYLRDGTTIPKEAGGVIESSLNIQRERLKEVLSTIFTREDYEEFVELFTEKLKTRLMEQAANIGHEDAAEKTVEEPVSDAYIAYQNLTHNNRIHIFLKSQ